MTDHDEKIFAHITTKQPRHLGFNPIRFAYWRKGRALYRGDGPGSFRGRITRSKFLTKLENLVKNHDCEILIKAKGD